MSRHHPAGTTAARPCASGHHRLLCDTCVGVVAVSGLDSKGAGGFLLRHRRRGAGTCAGASAHSDPAARPVVQTYQQNEHLFLAVVAQGMPAAEALAALAVASSGMMTSAYSPRTRPWAQSWIT